MADLDRDIWDEFRNGNEAAFEQLLMRYYRALFDYGMRFQKDPDQLRDDLHDLMVNLWERRENLQSTDYLKFYLFKALRHHIYNGKKNRHTFLDWESVREEEVSAEGEAIFSFEREEANALQSNQIQRILSKLSKRQQEVLHLKFFEDLTNEQIAELLSISRPATANLLYVALSAFKILWKAEYYPLLILLIS